MIKEIKQEKTAKDTADDNRLEQRMADKKTLLDKRNIDKKVDAANETPVVDPDSKVSFGRDIRNTPSQPVDEKKIVPDIEKDTAAKVNQKEVITVADE